jgi:hypoxanthine-guanine phosphoribosyltransferase
MTQRPRDPLGARVDLTVRGRRVLIVEDLAEKLGKTPSAIRSTIHRQQVVPAGYVTRNVPVYYPEDLGIKEEQ